MRLILTLVCVIVLYSCQHRVICSAFQSTYILDDSTRTSYYSYVWQLDEVTRATFLAKQSNAQSSDSLGIVGQPKTDYYAYAGEKVVPWREVKKTKYGIIKYEPYWLKNYRMRTAPKENILAPELTDQNFAASDFTDSLNADLVVKEERKEQKYLFKYDPRDNFNVEQEYYNKYYGKVFLDNRPPPDTLAQNQVVQPDSLQTKAGLKGLFKRKKQKATTEEPIDSGQKDEN